MPVFRRQIDLAANGLNDNVLAGSEFEFPGVPSVVSVAAVQEGTAGTGEIDVQFGQEVQITRGNIPTEEGTGQGPKVPEDNLVKGVVPGGDRIIVRLRETAGVATDIRVSVEIVPL